MLVAADVRKIARGHTVAARKKFVPNFTLSDGRVAFAPKQYKDCAALLLSKGVVYTTWASHCDIGPYTSWVIAYDASTLRQVGVLNVQKA